MRPVAQLVSGNLSRIVERWAQASPAKCALHYQGAALSYAALWQRIEAATATLAHRHAVGPGERIAYLGLNHPDFVVMLMALARLGAIAVPLNFRLAAAELAAILEHSGACILFSDGAMRALADEAAGLCGVRVEPASALCDAGGHPARLPLAGHDDADVLLVYSSGTTGRPKGAPHSQANLLWNIEAAIAAQDITAEDHVLSALPMFHVGGLCIQLLPVLAAGGSATLHARFDAGAWIGDVQLRRPSLSLLVPATLRAVLDHPDWGGADLSSLRLLATGSSIVPLSLINAVHARGVPVTQVYGATETGPVSIVLRAEDAVRKAGSAGKPALHVQARLVGADGSDCADGATGEIWLRGRNVVKGYWREAQHAAFENGWFHTGDLARRDEAGYYWVVGRSVDMIISGGENIYPAELESVLADCAHILEATVVGQDDARWGEVAVAVVVRKPGATLDEADVKQLFEGRLARYKHPRRVVFCDALPKTALGKVQKAELIRRLG